MFNLFNHGIDSLTRPFSVLSPVGSIALISLFAAFVLLLVFKNLSNQEMIKLHKNSIFGNFLEIALYRDQFRRIMLCLAGVLKHNFLYIRYFIPPVLVMLLPMSVICLQLQYRLGYQSLMPGSSFIIAARLEHKTGGERVKITTSPGITIETPALRDKQDDQIFWRARVKNISGEPFIKISLPEGNSVVKRLSVAGGPPLARFTPEMNKDRTLMELMTGGEDSVPAASDIKSLRVNYPAARYPFFAWHLSPIVYFVVLTLAFGLVLRPILKVRL